MQPQDKTVERKVARLVRASYGVVTRSALEDAGVSNEEIKQRVRRGTLLREHRGVYRVGHQAPSIEASYLAAVRACGEGALLSGPAAGHLLRLLKGKPPSPQVTAPTQRRVEGIEIRHSRHIDPQDVTTFRGIPVTTVPRTLVDLAAALDAEHLARACHEAGVLYRTTPRHVEAVLARRPNSPGAGKLRTILRGDTPVVLSKLERAFLKLLRENGLPLPETNRPAGGFRVDCRWPRHELTVELDSYRFHNSRHSWEQDRRREREARARGDELRRYTWGDVFEDPPQMLAELCGLLTAAD